MRDNYEDYRPWIGVDLDGTLAEGMVKFNPLCIGQPVRPIVNRVLSWLKKGRRVKIFTARVCVTGQKSEAGTADEEFAQMQHYIISVWSKIYLGADLEVTCIKDFLCEEIYDDRAWRVENGKIIGKEDFMLDWSADG